MERDRLAPLGMRLRDLPPGAGAPVVGRVDETVFLARARGERNRMAGRESHLGKPARHRQHRRDARRIVERAPKPGVVVSAHDQLRVAALAGEPTDRVRAARVAQSRRAQDDASLHGGVAGERGAKLGLRLLRDRQERRSVRMPGGRKRAEHPWALVVRAALGTRHHEGDHSPQAELQAHVLERLARAGPIDERHCPGEVAVIERPALRPADINERAGDAGVRRARAAAERRSLEATGTPRSQRSRPRTASRRR